jgi:hypothetical protein
MPAALEFAYDDLFLFAPSVLAYERALAEGLTEGKALGTAPEVDLVFLDKDRTMDAFLRPEEFGLDRRSGTTVGKKALKKTQARIESALNELVFDYQSKAVDEDEFRTRAAKLMKGAWKEVFIAGVRASGVKSPVHKEMIPALSAEDTKWLRSAMQHEMRFLNGMLTAIVERTYRMPLPRRIRMYADALESFYDSARVMGLPATVSIHWLLRKKDERTCASCLYLEKHSPYSKKTLPTTPRSGATLCLTNCRDRLLIRIVEGAKAQALMQASPTRGEHIKRLRRIKRLGHA